MQRSSTRFAGAHRRGRHRALLAVGGLVLSVPTLLIAQDRPPEQSRTPVSPGEPTAVPSTITAATLHASGARVTRRAEVPAAPGIHTVKIGPLPAILDESGIQAEGPEHLRVVSVQVERTAAGDQAPPAALAIEEQLDALQVEHERLARRRTAAEQRLQRYGSLSVEPPPKNPEAPEPTAVTPDRWADFIALATTGMSRAHADLAAVRVEIRDLDRRIRQLRDQLAQIAAPGRTTQVHALVAVRNTTGAPGALALSYAVPNALWYPSYTVRIDPASGQLEVSMYGVVHQATGEDWPEIAIALSTALPEAGAAVPELASHRIRRDRYADRGRVGLAYDEFAEEEEALRMADARVERVRSAKVDLRRSAARAEGPIGGRAIAASPAPEPPRRPRAPARDRAESANFERRVAEKSQQPTLSLGTLAEDLKKMVVDLPEVELHGQVHSLLDGCVLPTPTNARGFLRTLHAVREEAVPSDGAPHRLLLGRVAIAFTEERLVRAELAEHAFRRIRAALGGEEPLLAGGASVFLDDAYLGMSLIPTTAPGEEIVLDLGVDERVAVNRRTEEREEDIGVFSKERRYHTTVVVELVNHHEEAVTVDVRERVPFTEEEKIDIAVGDATRPAPARIGDRNGIYDWSIAIPPGAKREVTLEYRIDAPRDWQLTRWENLDRLEEEE